jgi:hypothetical protein
MPTHQFPLSYSFLLLPIVKQIQMVTMQHRAAQFIFVVSAVSWPPQQQPLTPCYDAETPQTPIFLQQKAATEITMLHTQSIIVVPHHTITTMLLHSQVIYTPLYHHSATHPPCTSNFPPTLA